MKDQELRLECLRQAVAVWNSLENDDGIEVTGYETLELAQSFYDWVIDNG